MHCYVYAVTAYRNPLFLSPAHLTLDFRFRGNHSAVNFQGARRWTIQKNRLSCEIASRHGRLITRLLAADRPDSTFRLT